MGRTKDPNTKYRMKLFISNSHRYAVTSDSGYNKDRKWVSNITTWGNLTEENEFRPNIRFLLLSSDEKRKYIFPEGWDISEAYATRSAGDDEGERYAGEDMYRIYGTVFSSRELSTPVASERTLSLYSGRILQMRYSRYHISFSRPTRISAAWKQRQGPSGFHPAMG